GRRVANANQGDRPGRTNPLDRTAAAGPAAGQRRGGVGGPRRGGTGQKDLLPGGLWRLLPADGPHLRGRSASHPRTRRAAARAAADGNPYPLRRGPTPPGRGRTARQARTARPLAGRGAPRLRAEILLPGYRLSVSGRRVVLHPSGPPDRLP